MTSHNTIRAKSGFSRRTASSRNSSGTSSHADPAEVKRWYDVMGPAFHALHHYCWGLMKTNRALLLARTQQVRTYYLASR